MRGGGTVYACTLQTYLSAYPLFQTEASWTCEGHGGRFVASDTFGRCTFRIHLAGPRALMTWGSQSDRSSLTPQCLVSLCRRMDFARSRPDTGVGGSGGAVLASVPARRGRLGGTATTTTGDSRRGTGNGGNGSAGVSRVLSFLGEAVGACCRCCRGWLLL